MRRRRVDAKGSWPDALEIPIKAPPTDPQVDSAAHPAFSNPVSQSSTVPQIHLVQEAVLSLPGELFRTGGLAVAVYISGHADQAHQGRDHVRWV